MPQPSESEIMRQAKVIIELNARIATLEAEIDGRVAIRQMDMEKIAEAAERERKLREALDLLAAEALALLDCYAASLPAVVATTNINCLRRAAEAARALLKEE